MKIQFEYPNNGGAFLPSSFHQYPEGPGIYIYGFRMKIGNRIIFIPLYVGIAKDLRFRLWQHYCEEKSGGNSKWYVFNYANLHNISDVNSLYQDMLKADSYRGINTKRFSDSLIWFNHPSFFNVKLQINNTSNYAPNSGVLSSILNGGDLDYVQSINPSCSAQQLKKQIIQSKAIFDNGFYFAFASLDNHIQNISKKHELFNDYQNYTRSKQYMNGRKNGVGKRLCERIEHATKKALNQIKIHTSAKSNGKLYNMDIDLTTISKDLVNMGDHIYNSKPNVYKNPLIITV